MYLYLRKKPRLTNIYHLLLPISTSSFIMQFKTAYRTNLTTAINTT